MYYSPVGEFCEHKYTCWTCLQHMLFLINRNQLCVTSLILCIFATIHPLNTYDTLLFHVSWLLINHYGRTIDLIVQMNKHVHIELITVFRNTVIMIPFSQLFSVVIYFTLSCIFTIWRLISYSSSTSQHHHILDNTHVFVLFRHHNL